ncbi:liprin-beta-1 [Trichonephila clavipes]|nr:liprin-beta-1 [Trichonephila clavipes]
MDIFGQLLSIEFPKDVIAKELAQNFVAANGKTISRQTAYRRLVEKVNVLSDQVEAQNEKIMELESSLSRSKEQLISSEALLRKEMTSRTSVESSKLDLMAQISSMRLRLQAVEEEKREIEERNRKLENELILTCACLAEKEADLATFKSKLARNGSITPIFDSNPEMEKLRGALSTVMAANDEKERKIQEMRTSLNRYKKLHELVLSNHARKTTRGLLATDHVILNHGQVTWHMVT